MIRSASWLMVGFLGVMFWAMIISVVSYIIWQFAYGVWTESGGWGLSLFVFVMLGFIALFIVEAD